MVNRTLKIDTDPQSGDLYLQLTDELMDEMSWSVGDTLLWEEQENGSWSLRKKDASIVE